MKTKQKMVYILPFSEGMCVFPLAFRTGISDFPLFSASLRAFHHQLFDSLCIQLSFLALVGSKGRIWPFLK